MITINYKDARPIYEQIKSGLRAMMTSGELRPGGKLPSVRELAVSMAINPNTIQRAYRELENEGVICSVQGKGSFVAEDFSPDTEKISTLLAALDDTVAKLCEAGMNVQDICARILNGGETK